jgi:hypothetical protein
MKMAIFQEFVPCSLVEIDKYFRGAYCFIFRAMSYLIVEAVNTSEI